jgi:hypothetical protein
MARVSSSDLVSRQTPQPNGRKSPRVISDPKSSQPLEHAAIGSPLQELGSDLTGGWGPPFSGHVPISMWDVDVLLAAFPYDFNMFRKIRT